MDIILSSLLCVISPTKIMLGKERSIFKSLFHHQKISTYPIIVTML